MSSKKSKKSNKSDETKRNVQTKKKASEKHSKEEIISKEELDNRIAIDGDIRLYLTVLLKIFIDGHFHHPKKKKLINLAQYVYDQKKINIQKNGGYKLMEFKNKNTKLAAMKKPVKEKYMKKKKKKKEQAEKVKSKY